MANFFSRLFKTTSESVLGIDIGSSTIKIIQLKKKGGKAILDTYGELALGPYAGVEVGRATNLPYEKIAEALVDILREAGTTTKKAGVAIPFGASLMSLMELPDVPAKDLSQMIPIEARKYIPVPINEVMLDWWVIPKVEDRLARQEQEDIDPTAPKVQKKIDVLVVAIHNDSIDKYQRIVEKSAIEASFFEIEIFSTIRAVLDQDVAPVMIFDMGAALTKLYIVERGIIKTSHTINRGSQDITLKLSQSLNVSVDNAEIIKRNYGGTPSEQDTQIAEIVGLSLEYVFTEANRVMGGFQKKFNKNITKVIMVGGGVKLFGILDMAKTYLQTEVLMGDPFSKVEAPAFLQEALRKSGPEFSVAIGIALRKLHDNG